MTDRQKTIDAFERCIRITDEGQLCSDCDDCPNKSDEWKTNGYAACDDFSELSVDLPWQLAKDILELAKEQEPKPLVDDGEDFITIDGQTKISKKWKCGRCGNIVAYCEERPLVNFCHICGIRIKEKL